MKRLFLLIGVLFLFGVAAKAQPGPTGQRVINRVSDPSTCQPGFLYHNTVTGALFRGSAGNVCVADATGAGTVTSVDTAAANNGVTATWANTTTTPRLTIGLGAITPSSITTTGTISSGSGASTAGYVGLKQGTAQSIVANTVGFTAPTSVTGFNFVFPAASATGFMLGTDAANVNTLSFVANPLPVANGGRNATDAATADNALVGDGSGFIGKALGSCSAGTSALTYNTTTHAFGCNSITGGIATGDSPTVTGAWTFSKNSAVSLPTISVTGTWFTGGSATTTKPHFLIETTGATSTGWSTSGTGLGVNAANAFAGNLLDLQVNGTSEFSVAATGRVTTTGVGVGVAPAAGTVSVGNGNEGLRDNADNLRISSYSSTGSNNVQIYSNQFTTSILDIGTTAVTIKPSGSSLLWTNDNTGDIGASGATRPRSLFLGTNATVGGSIINPGIATDATHTDTSVCQDTTTHTLLFGSGAAGICLGSSSLRFKNNVQDSHYGLAEIMRLRPRQFFFNNGYGDGGAHVQYGFIAEEMVKPLPTLVRPDANGKPQSIDYMALMPVLVHSIQEQQAQIETLKATVAKQQKQISRLRHRR